MGKTAILRKLIPTPKSKEVMLGYTYLKLTTKA